MNKYLKISILLALLLLPVFIILTVRSFSQVNYIGSSLYKIVFLTPLLYRFYVDRKTWKEAITEGFSLRNFKIFLPRTIVLAIVLALLYGLIYFLLKEYIPLQEISASLTALAQITTANIFLIGAYIIIFNSLLEEFFWRGFLFKELAGNMPRWLAHSITGIGFSLHHMMFYYHWFDFPLLIIPTVGLIFFSIVMNIVFWKSNDLFSCWLIHAFTDCVHIFIGLKIFGII